MEAEAIAVIRPGALAETATISRAAEASGLTEKAIRRKIDEGVWIEGRQYHRAPDGRIYSNSNAGAFRGHDCVSYVGQVIHYCPQKPRAFP